MSGSGVSRRDFLQIVGLGGTAVALAGCGNTSIESGAELVESYVDAGEFRGARRRRLLCIDLYAMRFGLRHHGPSPGRSGSQTGRQPGSGLSGGKICGLGQAAVQQHWSPDRLTTPMIRENGALVPASWEKAMALLGATVTPADGAGRRAWLTGPTSGHHQILLRGLVEAGGATDYVVYDALSTAVEASVNRKMFGVDDPVTLIDKAGLVLSFGNDFLGAGASPVAAAPAVRAVSQGNTARCAGADRAEDHPDRRQRRSMGGHCAGYGRGLRAGSGA